MTRAGGRQAVVTGATGGIGAACARAFAARGARVALIARSAGALESLAAELGPSSQPLPCDVTDGAALRAAFDAIDPPDVVITCAGGNRPQPLLELTEDALDRTLAAHVKGTILTTQAAARRMIADARRGAIVHVTSQMGHVGAPLRTAYCAAKHGVEGASKAMALELAPHGIRVNTVAPTFVETAMTASFLADPEFREDVLRRIPLGRLGAPDEVAAAVLFAASPEAGLVTGASLLVDGGWTAR